MAEREQELRAGLGLDGTAVLEPPRRRLSGPRGGEYRAISAAPGAPSAAALPPSRSTPNVIAPTPRQLEQRRDKHP